jgi:hypothetical protein
MEKFLAIVGAITLAVGLVAALAFLNGTLLWVLWDNIMPKLFSVPDLTWWEAVSLSWIAGILFKSNITNTKD